MTIVSGDFENLQICNHTYIYQRLGFLVRRPPQVYLDYGNHDAEALGPSSAPLENQSVRGVLPTLSELLYVDLQVMKAVLTNRTAQKILNHREAI